MDKSKRSLLVIVDPLESISSVIHHSAGFDRLEDVSVLLLDGVIPHTIPVNAKQNRSRHELAQELFCSYFDWSALLLRVRSFHTR